VRVQIIPSKDQRFLKQFYGCNLWKIYEVKKVRHMKSHWNCKVQTEWDEYEIEVTHTYPHNHFGQKTTIKIKDSECRILPNKTNTI
jgi:hypothetical protein